MSDETKCPVCGEGVLAPFERDYRTSHKGVPGTVKTRFAQCGSCGTEIAGPKEAEANKQAMSAFRQLIEESLKRGGKEDA